MRPTQRGVEGVIHPRVLHLISEDGTTWTGDADASVLGDFAIELDDIGAVPSSAFVDDDGTRVMYGGGRLPGGSLPIIWRATAPGPDGARGPRTRIRCLGPVTWDGTGVSPTTRP